MLVLLFAIIYLILGLLFAGYLMAYDDIDDDGDPSFGIILLMCMLVFLPVWATLYIVYFLMMKVMNIGYKINMFIYDKFGH